MLTGLSPALPGLSPVHLGAPLVVTRPSMSSQIFCEHSQEHLKATTLVQSMLGFDHPGILVWELQNTPRGSQWHNCIVVMLKACLVHCHLLRSPWGRRAKYHKLCMLTLAFLAWYQYIPYQFLARSVCCSCHQLIRICSLSESHTRHTQLELSNNQIPAIATRGYDMSIELPHTLNTCWTCWSAESTQMVHPAVVPWIIWIPSTMKTEIILIVILKPSLYAMVCAHPYELIGNWSAFVHFFDTIE